jgi:uncharacterized protein (TIGR03085 family)
MTTAAHAERSAICDLFLEVGPDAPTLCEGWTTRDLAAHLVVRERRPDAALGIIASPLAAYGEKVRRAETNKDWDALVERVRSGPPIVSPTRIDAVDRLANTVEFFVHVEDVRRAQEGWEPRALDPQLEHDLRSALGRMAKLLVRKAPVGVTLAVEGGDPIHAKAAKDGQGMVTVSGPVGELVLFVYGRQAHARVGLVGDEADVAALLAARFGI